MEYCSNYIWETGEELQSSISLVLQHVQVRKKSLLLACVCESGNQGEVGVTESGYFTEGLVEWFHRSFLKQCERKQKDGEVEKLLQAELQRICQDIGRFVAKKEVQERLSFWGILLWENRFWIFRKGACQGYLVNRRFQRKHLRRLGSTEKSDRTVEGEGAKEADLSKKPDKIGEIQWISGRIQRNLGVLLCTEGFLDKLEPETVAEVLHPEGELTEERLGRRLQELLAENVCQGGRLAAGAVYLHT